MAARDPQCAHSLLTKGVVAKWKYLMRTTEADARWYAPLEDALSRKVLPTLLGVSPEAIARVRERTTLPLRYGGLGIPDPCVLSREEYQASREVTKGLQELISARGEGGHVLTPSDEDKAPR